MIQHTLTGPPWDEQALRGRDMRTKVPPVRNANGYSKDQFTIDLATGTVTCPANHTVAIRECRRHRLARSSPWPGDMWGVTWGFGAPG